MQSYSRIPVRFALSSTLLIVAGAGCVGAPKSSDPPAGQNKQHDMTATPLWTATFDKTPLSFHAAAVDDDGNTYIAAFTPQGGDVSLLYKIDTSGAFVFDQFVGSGMFFVDAVRANSTGSVTAATSFNGFPPQIRIHRFDPSGNTPFEYTGPATGSNDGGRHSVDICSDGSTVFIEHDRGSPSPSLAMVDASGAVQWTDPVDGMAPAKVRCYGDGQIVVGGTMSGSAALAFFQSDGTVGPSWTSSDTGATGVLFDRNGDVLYVGATVGGSFAVYAVDSSAKPQWSWTSAGPDDAFSGIASSAAITVVGTRNTCGALNDYIAQLDTSGNLRWDRTVPLGSDGGTGGVGGVSVDGAERAFVCDFGGGSSNAALYDTDGSTVWSASTAPVVGQFVDVTNAIARCVGPTGDGVGIVAFQVE